MQYFVKTIQHCNIILKHIFNYVFLIFPNFYYIKCYSQTFLSFLYMTEHTRSITSHIDDEKEVEIHIDGKRKYILFLCAFHSIIKIIYPYSPFSHLCSCLNKLSFITHSKSYNRNDDKLLK